MYRIEVCGVDPSSYKDVLIKIFKNNRYGSSLCYLITHTLHQFTKN